ncbi:Transcriptional regulator, TetR family [Cystobacter fuscus DSM 2262]|uniref:Transcriptional regulator, TetR family n=1 Tax=Cystobacter fuscus (strain ATCC 25194 / DSM 2262 / NBRC 100088 / M29) TaxID=1242864 RepID=S9QRX2_CYSF2|nr:TetR/AcrR family transcriptional regulator [Cystobacter fuscus]EPX59378.1 Transcriptional regulator, TetR family [Cystobacter fuscus DSM 2262]
MKDKTMKVPPRERILAAAEELFYREGIRGVGVEAIAARAETTKMALYRHFESKDALVTEWLRLEVARDEAVLERLAAEHPGDPRAQLLGWAKHITERLSGESDRGCPFLNSVAELPDRNHPARQVIEAHKTAQTRRVVALCAQAGLADPEAVASEFVFVIEGAQVSAQSMGTANACERLLCIVRRLLEEEPRPAAPRR